jgi:uncharacterized LabA/DUF88 family protein
MKRVAILIDGEWFRRRLNDGLQGQLGPDGLTAQVMYQNALSVLDTSCEELLRLFYYDCPPYEGAPELNPLDKSKYHHASTPKARSRHRFLAEFGRLDFVAMRLGEMKNRGWTLTNSFIHKALSQPTSPSPTPRDVILTFEQKGVDMRIGIDVATLSLKKIVDRIILLSGDTDLIPAIKLARREGVQISLAEVPAGSQLAKVLYEDADTVRELHPKP